MGERLICTLEGWGTFGLLLGCLSFMVRTLILTGYQWQFNCSKQCFLVGGHLTNGLLILDGRWISLAHQTSDMHTSLYQGIFSAQVLLTCINWQPAESPNLLTIHMCHNLVSFKVWHIKGSLELGYAWLNASVRGCQWQWVSSDGWMLYVWDVSDEHLNHQTSTHYCITRAASTLGFTDA
jgi:hypothetical protein